MKSQSRKFIIPVEICLPLMKGMPARNYPVSKPHNVVDGRDRAPFRPADRLWVSQQAWLPLRCHMPSISTAHGEPQRTRQINRCRAPCHHDHSLTDASARSVSRAGSPGSVACRSPLRRAERPLHRADEATIRAVRAVADWRAFWVDSFLTMFHDHIVAILGGGDVMPTDEIRAEFAALLDRVERDAFQRGWDAALKRVMAAAANAPHVEAATLPTETTGTQRRAGYGIVPALVNEMLDETTDRGIVPADVVVRSRERGDEIAESLCASAAPKNENGW